METDRKDIEVGDLKAVLDRIRKLRDDAERWRIGNGWSEGDVETVTIALAIVEKAGEMEQALERACARVRRDMSGCLQTPGMERVRCHNCRVLAAFRAAVQDAVKGEGE